MDAWPDVEFGRGEPPRPSGGWFDEDLIRTREPRVLVWGRVDGIPWQLEAWTTAPGPDARWWEHGPVGPEIAFWLGEGARYGGGGVETRLNEGTHFAASGHFFGSVPDVAAWAGVVSDSVERIEVRVGEEARRIELRRGPQWLPRFFCFFVPRGVVATIVAVGAEGEQLQAEALDDVDVRASANAGTSVNDFGYPAGRPPPGWPDDPTPYAPGEGPRHAEDFHLHEVTFPLYAVPPERWDGYAGLSGSGRSGHTVRHVDFGYLDEPGGVDRGFEVVNERPDAKNPLERPLREDDVGIWWTDEYFDSTSTAINFVARFLRRDEFRTLVDGHAWPNVGPRRVAEFVDADVGGRVARSARLEYRALPLFRSIRFELSDVRITLHGWAMSFEELTAHAQALERLELGTPLFHAMAAAQARSDARFREIMRKHHEGTRDP
jgi:hypothetical protein